MKKALGLIACFSILLSSCTVEKRLYTKGFNVQWKKKFAKAKPQPKTEESGGSVTIAGLPQRGTANPVNVLQPSILSNSRKWNIVTKVASNIPHFDFFIENKKKLRKEIEAGLLATINDLKLSPKDFKAELALHKYTERRFKPITTVLKQVPYSELEKSNGKNSDKAIFGEDKSQLVALVLAIIAGWLGVHRFYLGYMHRALLHLLCFFLALLLMLTIFLSILGILLFLVLLIFQIIDIVNIVTGDLQPRHGGYTDTLQ